MSAPAVLLEWSPSRPSISRRSKARRRFAVVLTTFLIGSLGLPVSAMADVFRWAGTDDRAPTDAIVVLGTAQFQGAPSPVFANRLAHAQELVRAGISQTIITVGGFQPGDMTSEAQVGKEELVAEGMRRRQVIALPFGKDTEGSLEAVAAIAESQDLRSVTLVTDPAHAARTRTLAVKLGLEAHVSPTDNGPGTAITSEYLLRESAGLISLWLE
jgi:uncharacterized SAM-binding protein YcdF (DUF218 family)